MKKAVPALLQGEDLAFWLRQRYNSLGQALSSSEAFINSLSSQQSTALPHVLARLQVTSLPASDTYPSASKPVRTQDESSLAPLADAPCFTNALLLTR